jgi:hypothetical protein
MQALAYYVVCVAAAQQACNNQDCQLGFVLSDAACCCCKSVLACFSHSLGV